MDDAFFSEFVWLDTIYINVNYATAAASTLSALLLLVYLLSSRAMRNDFKYHVLTSTLVAIVLSSGVGYVYNIIERIRKKDRKYVCLSYEIRAILEEIESLVLGINLVSLLVNLVSSDLRSDFCYRFTTK